MSKRFIKLCGNCNNWMKSRECSREKNINGYSRGPSMNESPCLEYMPTSAILISILKRELV